MAEARPPEPLEAQGRQVVQGMSEAQKRQAA
jgi:hypothetical protein